MDKLPLSKLNLFFVAGTVATFIGTLIALIDYSSTRSSLSNGDSDSKVQQNTYENVNLTRRIKVGYIPYFEVTSREASSGQVSGFLVDVLHAVAADLGVPESNIEFHETTWDTFGIGLEEGKYDLSIAGTFRTPIREELVDFTDPIFFLGNGALVRGTDERFSSIRSVSDLDKADITVAVVMGEYGDEYAKKNLKRPTIHALPGPDLTLAPLEVQEGRADVALSDQYILSRYAMQHPGVRDIFQDNPYHVLPICWAVRKRDHIWLEKVNQSLKKLHDDGWVRNLRLDYPTIPFAMPANSEASPAVATPGSRNIGYLLRHYFRAFLVGITYTLVISFSAIVLGTLLGAPMGIASASDRKGVVFTLLRRAIDVYIYSFLAIPTLVLIIMLYYNQYISALNSTTAAILALGINLSPFAAKIIHTGINNIPESQILAAKTFGYSPVQIALKFKLPLMLRSVGQPLLVEYFTTIKLSSLASVIGVTEILHRSQQIIRETYMTEESYLVLVLSYMVIIVPIAVWADCLDRRWNAKEMRS